MDSSPIRPPSFYRRGKGGRRGRGRRKGGPRPLPLSNSDSPWGGTSLWAALPLPYGPYGPLLPPTNSCNSSVLQKISESLGTFPMFKYSLPIYRSLRINHFETPRHVRDLIWDSEQISVIKSHNTNRHRTLSVRTLRVRELCRHD